ncbi:MAG: hypothetical protein DHS20C09_10180 [marine bacterium B5-7]|jgi:DNA-binding CsgD family transcriptional regulator|nr:MAG: hypothetical protein DHS20C09_10180 [marine bacterium B5-7]
MDEAVVVGRLSRWALWKMNSGIELGYKRKVNFVRLTGDDNKEPNCGYDMECQQTEVAVRQLPVVPREVIRVEYLSTAKNDVSKADRLGVSVRTFHNYKHDAYRLLGNILSSGLTHDAVKVYKSAIMPTSYG